MTGPQHFACCYEHPTPTP